MLINFYKDKRFECTVNYDKVPVVTPFGFWFTKNDGYMQSIPNILAEEISIYAALGEKLICVNLSDEYETGYKIIPLSDFSFAREREKA